MMMMMMMMQVILTYPHMLQMKLPKSVKLI